MGFTRAHPMGRDVDLLSLVLEMLARATRSLGVGPLCGLPTAYKLHYTMSAARFNVYVGRPRSHPQSQVCGNICCTLPLQSRLAFRGCYKLVGWC